MAAAAMVVVLLSLTGGMAGLGSVVIARHRAQAAADLGALAAAAALPGGQATACSRAVAVVEQMHATATGCTVKDLGVVVSVRSPIAFITGPIVGPVGAQASARAGPAGR